MRKKTTTEREAIFVRLKKANRDFIHTETAREQKLKESFVTHQDTLDRLVAGYRKMKKENPKIAAIYFE